MSMYLHKKLNLTEDWGVTHTSWGVRRRKPKTSQNEPENRFLPQLQVLFNKKIKPSHA